MIAKVTRGSEELSSGQCAAQAERPKNARSTLDVAADEEAFRLRSEGRTFREIAEVMGVNPSVAHRRVKRQLLRQKMNLSERLEETREMELEKLRWIEQALLSDAKSGDYIAIKLVLRIMDMRRKYLKDIPPEQAEQVPRVDDDHCEKQGTAPERARANVDVDVACEDFSQLETEPQQPLAVAGVTTNAVGATKAPTNGSQRRPKAISRKARRKKRPRRK